MTAPGPRFPHRRRALSRVAGSLAWLLIFFCAILPARAQYRFDVWTADNGLPQNVIRGIEQTPDGYLWIATFDGLARFDGVHFTIFNKSNTPGFTSNRFGAMYQDRDGDLWLTTEAGGVTRYHQGSFRAYGPAQGIPDNIVRGITGDRTGHVWILTADDIAEWNEASGKFVNIPQKFPGIHFEPFAWDTAGFWGQDKTKLYCFIRGRFVVYNLPPWLPSRSIWGTGVDATGAIWIESVDQRHTKIAADGAITGPFGQVVTISYVDDRGHPWTVRIGSRLIRSLEYPSLGKVETIGIGAIYQDRERNLWLGSLGQGLYRFQVQSVQTYSTDQGLIDRNVYPIYQDHTGAIWLGAWDSGFSRFRDGKFANFVISNDPPAKLPTAIAEDGEGRLWVATHDGLSVFQNGRFGKVHGPLLPSGAVVQAMFLDRQGTMWFGTSQGLVSFKDGMSTLFTTRDGLAVDDVRVIAEDASGNLWIGGYGGLTRLHDDKLTHWTEHDGLPSNNVRAIYIDSDGVIWIGTYDGGLGRLKDGKFTRYTMRKGLFNDGVFQILEDARGNLWMSCNRGIYRVSKRELNEFADGKRGTITSVPYGKVDGMLNIECNGGLSPAGIKARDGKLWFPTQNGAAVIDPETVTTNPQPPPLVIESIMVDRVPISLDGPIRISPGKESLEIQYTALSFIKSEQIRFKYRMDRFDSNWVDAGLRRTAYYSHVPPGQYVFRVIAENSDGVWNNEGKALTITILAPFYKTPWFEMLMVLAAAALVLIAWRYRVMQLERANAMQQAFSRQLIASQESERKRIAAELHDSLGQRLIVIKNLAAFMLRSREKLDSPAAQTLDEISGEAASAINETREISYDLRPFQLDRLGLTKAIEGMIRTVATASGIRFSKELDNIDDLFPEELRINFYRIVQECLNNVVKHSQATEASVRITHNARSVVLTIDDNGRGFSPAERSAPASSNGFGLTGMAERASLLGGDFKVRSAPGRGTTMTVEIPLGVDNHKP